MLTHLLLLVAANSALAAEATFDQLVEGDSRRRFVEDGVELSQFDNLSDPPPCVMSVEQADGDLTGLPGFSPKNTLGFGGYVPGVGTAYGSFGSLEIRALAGSSTHGRVEVFEFGNSGQPLRLEAWRGGTVVATDTTTLSSTWVITHHTLEVSGVTFDHLRLVSGDGQVFLEIDSVFLEGDPVDTGATGVDTATVDAGDSDADTDTPARGATDTAEVTEPGASDVDDPPDVPAVGGSFAYSGCSCEAAAAAPTLPWLVGALTLLRRRRR